MAKFSQTYKAKGVLTLSDMELTETKKEGIFTHDLKSALQRFEGQEVSFTVTLDEEVAPKEEE